MSEIGKEIIMCYVERISSYIDIVISYKEERIAYIADYYYDSYGNELNLLLKQDDGLVEGKSELVHWHYEVVVISYVSPLHRELIGRNMKHITLSIKTIHLNQRILLLGTMARLQVNNMSM
jgi:hypothetical protein